MLPSKGTRAVTYLSLCFFLCIALALKVAIAQSQEDDDDEFSGRSNIPSSSGAHYQPQQADEASPLFSSSLPPPVFIFKLEDIILEIGLVFGLFCYLIAHLYGKSQNSKVAKAWANATAGVWEAHFASVGCDDGNIILRDGPKDFIFFASGRNVVKDVYCWLKLAPRQEFYTWIIDKVLSNDSFYDKMSVTFTIDAPNVDAFIFAILPKKKATAIAKERYDLLEFTKKRVNIPKFNNEDYHIYSDTTEFVNILLADTEMQEYLHISSGVSLDGKGKAWRHPLLESVIFSEQPAVKPQKPEEVDACIQTLKFEIRFPNCEPGSQKFNELLAKMTSMMMLVVDYIGQHGNLTAETRAKLQKSRALAKAQLGKPSEEERREELAQKKIREKKEKEEKVAKLSPDERRRYEEKERKKEAKKLANKRMKKGQK